jgi:hypothetical protein
MINIHTMVYLLLISVFMATWCSANESGEASDESGLEGERRDFASNYLEQSVGKRSVGVHSTCSATAKCSDDCYSGKQYGKEETCGLVCYANSPGGAGTSGTCNTNSDQCPGATSTFCPGGKFTVRKNIMNNNKYFNCDKGYGCGKNRNDNGCCVRVVGLEKNSNNKYYCITCEIPK